MEVNFGANYQVKMPKLVEQVNMATVQGKGLYRVDYETGVKMPTNAKDIFMVELRENMLKNGSKRYPSSRLAFDQDGNLNIDSKMDRKGIFNALIEAFQNIKHNGFLGNLLGSDEKANKITQNALESYKYGLRKQGQNAEIVDLTKGLDANA